VARRDLLDLLTDQDLAALLAFTPSLLGLLAALPGPEMVPLLRARPRLLHSLPPAAEPVLAELLAEAEFLAKLPTELLAELAAAPAIARLVGREALVQLLTVHPRLPALLPAATLAPYLDHLADPWVRARLPCRAVAAVAARPEVVAALGPSGALEAVMTSERLLSCIPRPALERLVAAGALAGLPLPVLVRGAGKLPGDRYSLGLAGALLRGQLPAMVRGRLAGLLLTRRRRK
jgi:hypothetical protein